MSVTSADMTLVTDMIVDLPELECYLASWGVGDDGSPNGPGWMWGLLAVTDLDEIQALAL